MWADHLSGALTADSTPGSTQDTDEEEAAFWSGFEVSGDREACISPRRQACVAPRRRASQKLSGSPNQGVDVYIDAVALIQY